MTRSLASLLTSATLALPACIIDHGLGETAESGSAESSGSDTTGVDPSATSGPPSDGTDTGNPPMPTSTSADPATATSGTETGDGPLCDPGEYWVQWNPQFPEPLPGIDASFAAVLGGPCTLTGTFSGSPGGGQAWLWEIYLECTLSGRIDGDANVVDQVFELELEGSSAAPLEEWLPFLEADPLALRVVLDFWGMGWNRYAVLERGSTPAIDLVAAEHTDPLQGVSWIDDIQALLGGQPWHGPMTITPQADECGGAIGKCGEIAQGLEIGWQGGGSTVLHGGQDDGFGTDRANLSVHAAVTAAADISQPTCTDTPLGDYRVAVWAVDR